MKKVLFLLALVTLSSLFFSGVVSAASNPSCYLEYAVVGANNWLTKDTIYSNGEVVGDPYTLTSEYKLNNTIIGFEYPIYRVNIGGELNLGTITNIYQKQNVNTVELKSTYCIIDNQLVNFAAGPSLFDIRVSDENGFFYSIDGVLIQPEVTFNFTKYLKINGSIGYSLFAVTASPVFQSKLDEAQTHGFGIDKSANILKYQCNLHYLISPNFDMFLRYRGVRANFIYSYNDPSNPKNNHRDYESIDSYGSFTLGINYTFVKR